MRNYLLNNGENVERSLPDCLREILDQNPRLKMNATQLEILENLKNYIDKRLGESP